MTENKSDNHTEIAAPENDSAAEQVAPVSIESVSPKQFEELKERAAKAEEHWDRFLRATAELDNYRKRAIREKQEATRFANEALLEKLVPVLDNFDMALASAKNAQGDVVQSLKTGINMIHQQLRQVLMDSGLEELDAEGKAFDPNFHEAISQRDAADVPEGQVLQQLRKGYKLRERLIRPATVIVAKKPSA
jgi:molecular chaperone GrpE